MTLEKNPPDLAALQSIINRSIRTATPSVADSLAFPARQMTAPQFVEFWTSVRLVAMATVGDHGQPHIAPVHARIEGATLRLVIYDNTVRRVDLSRNPRVAFTTWDADGAAAIVYGRAREIDGSIRDARPGQSGKPRSVVEIEVTLTRIYAMRAPSRSSIS
ncbi:MAG: pyridoxamine 5'-phosphate oxidase family protein [Candidatus Binatus sp.]|uniref:pyridoxamine 5'-phosphate oxidase family protein n=1 Tax=Candidatus Binatus sp. TaxID=2811406 RepID=UPI00271CA814|nr:pyridoxamine 5'-phosphate oxidase family protein [Candidatus Binatus sp.]MDO8431201.1 pyridoxamine 5'-phosphate oxidase family protein [Candidatus Binatus sp.]